MIKRLLSIFTASAAAAVIFSGCGVFPEKKPLSTEPANNLDKAVRALTEESPKSAYENCLDELSVLLQEPVTFEQRASELLPPNDAAYIKTGDSVGLGDTEVRTVQFGFLQENMAAGDTVLAQCQTGTDHAVYVQPLFSVDASVSGVKENVVSVTSAVEENSAILIKVTTSTYSEQSGNSVLKTYQYRFDGLNWTAIE